MERPGPKKGSRRANWLERSFFRVTGGKWIIPRAAIADQSKYHRQKSGQTENPKPHDRVRIGSSLTEERNILSFKSAKRNDLPQLIDSTSSGGVDMRKNRRLESGPSVAKRKNCNMTEPPRRTVAQGEKD